MDKTIGSKKTPKYLDLVHLSRKPKILRRERTIKTWSPSQTMSLKYNGFVLSWKQQYKEHNSIQQKLREKESNLVGETKSNKSSLVSSEDGRT